MHRFLFLAVQMSPGILHIHSLTSSIGWCRLNLSCKYVCVASLKFFLNKTKYSRWGMWFPIHCPNHSYPFTHTLSTCPLKAFEFNLPTLCFILTHNNQILHTVERMLMICGRIAPSGPQMYP